jgi:hypothetical protein
MRNTVYTPLYSDLPERFNDRYGYYKTPAKELEEEDVKSAYDPDSELQQQRGTAWQRLRRCRQPNRFVHGRDLGQQWTHSAYDRAIDFPGTVWYVAEPHTVCIPICLHMEYLHFLYYCQHWRT